VAEHPKELKVPLPGWLLSEVQTLVGPFPDPEQRLSLVLELARQNFIRDTGGPFAACVFRTDTWELVSAGVNRVVPGYCSPAHAEIMALGLAQHRLNTFDLGGPGMPEHELCVSWRPCAMCFGALPWSGIRSLFIAGSGPEVETITGFDEGPIHPDWRAELERRGIRVAEGSNRDAAIKVFHEFVALGRAVYNSRAG
jgi:tRNA(Arg) A34 adenosine deaminase TadA